MTQVVKSKDINNNEIVLMAYMNGKILEKIELKDFEKIYINFHIDKLTFLGNRELLKKVLNNREEKLLLYIDIKDFGSINEAYGEDFGNIVLNELSINIKKDFFDFDIYRAGGDIFALLLKEGSSNYSSSQIENKVHQFFLKPFIVRNEEINLCSTVALVKGCNNVLNKAEITLREAKQNKKNFLEYNKLFAVQRKSKYDEYKVLMNKIITAIKEDRIYPVYQPIFSNLENKVVKYEALARLKTIEGKELTPYMFLDIAKKNNQYSEITKSIVKKSLEYFNNNTFGISINLSLMDITNIDTVNFIINEVDKFSNPKRISFEILEDESIILLDSNTNNMCCEKSIAVNKFFTKINEVGCSIAIDDFGAGYSNFINILKLKPQIIKIDGSIISKLNEIEVKIIVELLVEYSKKIGCEIIAEYVSDEDVQKMAKDLNINYSQGYYIGKPISNIL